uniref:Uncharacterized protein n=1 Tax=Tanacetum cinerariifolium TaxID=118510 RepID=A0A6L2LP56_TANCI|nr:hypothetical protein [Tanacetum cinerariifolium]
MNDKMKDPECMNQKVKIAPHDYSKENFLATFTPQKQLTPKQIFWSQYLIKMKTKALKEQTTASRPIKALTMYPPNTSATLVPRRITPTRLTEGERGVEQTKECYLTKVILFFKTLKEHFEGIQKAPTKEKKDVFKELEDEVAQNVIDRKQSVETIREIVKEAKVVRPLDSSIVFACHDTKHSQELLEYVIGTFLQDSHQRDKKHAPAPLIRKKQVTSAEQCDTSNSNTHKHVAKLNTQKTNVPVPPSTGVNRCTDASGS